MARPLKVKRVCQLPLVTEFAPKGRDGGGEVALLVEELEAIRLIDALGLSQEECAARMEVGRSTVQAIYESARRKLAQALVGGKALKIGGGAYVLCPQSAGCCGKRCRGANGGKGRCRGGACCPKGGKASLE